jgi:hypothetical protein
MSSLGKTEDLQRGLRGGGRRGYYQCRQRPPTPRNRADDSHVGPYGSVMTADLKRASVCEVDSP